MKNILAYLLTAALMVSTPLLAEEAELKAPEGYAFSGAVVKHVRVRNIKRTEVVDDHTILFFMTGKKIYANIMKNRCAGLKRENRFGYEVRVGQLSDLDVITVLDAFGVRNHCGLGKFHEVSKTEDDQPIAK